MTPPSTTTTPTAVPVHRISAVLNLPRRKTAIAPFATAVLNAMTGNASLPNPTIPLSTVTADLSAFQAAEASVVSRVKGATATRNEAYATLHADLQHLLAYVQLVADANPATAQSIIESAGMSVRKNATHPKSALSVEAGPASGSVKLVAKAVARRASYEWQFSTDQKNWTLAAVTLQAKTAIGGLTSGTVYYFRFRGVTAAGEGAFSQVVFLLVS
jgi:hypothetical protein